MSATETVDRVVRIAVTPDEFKRLKILAVERDQDLRTLVTSALQTSPLTARVFA